jgi:hypothetical protein
MFRAVRNDHGRSDDRPQSQRGKFQELFVSIQLAWRPKIGEQCSGDEHKQESNHRQPGQVNSFTVICSSRTQKQRDALIAWIGFLEKPELADDFPKTPTPDEETAIKLIKVFSPDFLTQVRDAERACPKSTP